MALRTLGARTKIMAAAVAVVTAAGVGAAVAETSSTPSNATHKGRGINEYGLTKAYFNGHKVGFTYTKGFFCDTHVHSTATSGCEVGQKFKKPPAKHFDPLFITVPLYANPNPMKMECPNGLICVDHPGTVDLTRLSSALGAPKSALRNVPTPGHDHFITDKNGGKPEWWDVEVIGVTKKSVFNAIRQHRSYSYIQKLRKQGNSAVTPNIPSNIFLFFGVN